MNVDSSNIVKFIGFSNLKKEKLATPVTAQLHKQKTKNYKLTLYL